MIEAMALFWLNHTFSTELLILYLLLILELQNLYLDLHYRLRLLVSSSKLKRKYDKCQLLDHLLPY